MSMNLKCYEYKIINPITSNCSNTDVYAQYKHVKPTHHDLYTNQYSEPY